MIKYISKIIKNNPLTATKSSIRQTFSSNNFAYSQQNKDFPLITPFSNNVHNLIVNQQKNLLLITKTGYKFSKNKLDNKKQDMKIDVQSNDEKIKKMEIEEQKNNMDSFDVQNQNNGVIFIQRIKKYSVFLKQGGKSNLEFGSNKDINQKGNGNGNKVNQNLLQKINNYFLEAGTTTKQISQSLEQIALKLQKMLNQNKKLLEKNKVQNNIQRYQKYKLRSEQFNKILTKLSTKYFPQPPQPSKLTPIQISLYLLDLQTKMNSLIQLLYGAIQQSNPYFKFIPDITNIIPNDDAFKNNKYRYAWSKIQIKQFDTVTKAKHDIVYDLLKKSVIMVTNAVVNQHTWSQWNNQIWKKVIFGLSFPVSLVNLQQAELHCYKLWRNPNIKMVKNLLDLPEKGTIQYAKKIIYPQIKENFFIYNHSAVKSTPQSKKTVESKQVTAQETSSNIFEKSQNSGRILVNFHEDLHFKGVKPADKLPNKIKRIMSQSLSKLPFTKKSSSPPSPSPSSPSSSPSCPPQIKQCQTIIIHIHGGGFISMSSQLMQNHTRIWSKQLSIPVFSLDYRKPPLHRFPQPLQDCIAGYKFIIQKIHQYMNVRVKNVILAGDSAGGNLVCAMQAWLMKEKYQVLPKGMLLMYPATDLRVRYTESRLNSFLDGIFLPSLLMLCQQEYLGKDRKNQFDPLASPILLTQSYVNPKSSSNISQKWPQAWPKTVIMSGKKDPLFDDSIRLLQRLTKDNIDCKMLLYKDFSHGFMSMDQILPGAKNAINDSVKELKNMIDSF